MSDTPLRLASLREIAEELLRRADGDPVDVEARRAAAQARKTAVDPETGGRMGGRRRDA